MLCSTSRDGRTLITAAAAFNRPCLARGKRQQIPSDGQLFGSTTTNNSRTKRPLDLRKGLRVPRGPKVRGGFEERRSEACERKRVQIMGLKFSLSQYLSVSQLNILADLLPSSIRGTQRQFSENICSEESLLGFSNI